MDKILSVRDVATVLQVKPITVREMFREKRLRAFKVGKSWRTTEKMLEEDIDHLARGENPPVLPSKPVDEPLPSTVSKLVDEKTVRSRKGSRVSRPGNGTPEAGPVMAEIDVEEIDTPQLNDSQAMLF